MRVENIPFKRFNFDLCHVLPKSLWGSLAIEDRATKRLVFSDGSKICLCEKHYQELIIFKDSTVDDGAKKQ